MLRVMKTRQQLLYESSMQRVERSMLLIDRSCSVLEEAAAHMKRSAAPFARPQEKLPTYAALQRTLS